MIKPSSEVGRRRHATVRRSAGLLLSMILAAGCSEFPGSSSTGRDHAVVMRLTNTGAAALQCRLLFGHWVERDLGALQRNETIEISLMQARGDGAFYVVRADGQRFMMIENIVCGRSGDWMASFGQIDFAPLRSSRPRSVAAICASPLDRGRILCSTIEVE